MCDRIPVSVDGSDTSSRACTGGVNWRRSKRAHLRILYVVSYAYVSAILGAGYTGDLLRRLRAEAQIALDADSWSRSQRCDCAGRRKAAGAEPQIMSRGLFIFFVQIIACLGVTGTGLWALLRSRHLQQFINSNFALLPAVSDKATSVLLRLLGAFALWYGYTLLSVFRQELSALGFG
jgi:hypothetical protein